MPPGYADAAAAASISQSVVSVPVAWPAGALETDRPASDAWTAVAFSAPAATIHTSRADWIAGNVRLTRSGGGLGESSTPTTVRSTTPSAALPGKSDATCPSGPNPRSSTSKRGTAGPSDASAESSCASAAAASSGVAIPSAPFAGIGWTFSGGISNRSISATRACVSFRSGSPVGRKRSSPHHRWTPVQSIAEHTTEWAACSSVAIPTVPPVSTTCTVARTACASRTRVSNLTATASARTLASGWTTTRRMRSALVDQGESLGQDLAVDLVGVEATQLLAQTLAEQPERHREGPRRLSWLHERRPLAVRAAEHDGSGSPFEPHFGDALDANLADHPDRCLERQCEPTGEQVERGVRAFAGDGDRANGLVRRRVEQRRQQATPQGEPGPGQVGVAGGMRRPESVQCDGRSPAVDRVRDPTGRHRPDAVVRGGLRPRVRPPRDDRCVGEQEWDHERVAMVRERARGPEHDDLARAGVAAHPDLGVEPSGPAAGVPGEHDDAARVLAARVVRCRDRFLGVAAVGVDDQVQHPAESDGAALLADPDEGSVDLAGGGVGELDDHG